MIEGNFRKLVDHAKGFESAKFELGQWPHRTNGFLWRIPLVSFNNSVIWRERNNVVVGNDRRERMRVHILQRTVLVRKMNHSTFARVIIRLSDLCDDGSARFSHLNRREPSFDLRIPDERKNCPHGENQNNAGNRYQTDALT